MNVSETRKNAPPQATRRPNLVENAAVMPSTTPYTPSGIKSAPACGPTTASVTTHHTAYTSAHHGTRFGAEMPGARQNNAT